MRYTGPKVKKARRFNFVFTAKDVKVLQRRNYAPGQHGQGRGRVSEYGIQLREKQKAKINYGISERQFVRYFEQALKQSGVTGDNLIKILEMRLDNVIYRLGLAESRAQARQLVSHAFFNVNDKKVNIPSYQLRVGDVVSVRPNKLAAKYFSISKEKFKNLQPQDWLQFSPQSISGKILSVPTPEMVGNQINTQLIVEHYSRI